MNQNPSSSNPPVVIGEVLFDHFPGGERVLGGAAFNVAWNLQGLGLPPLFISAVGDDDEGRLVRKRMTEWSMRTDELQTTNEHPTGTVQVHIDNGEPRFEILNHQAYDAIEELGWTPMRSEYSLLYQGSLAYRNERSRDAIRQVMRQTDLPRFVDINIRPPWFNETMAQELLDGATWIKLNEHELAKLSGEPVADEEQIARAVDKLRQRHDGQQFFVTLGSRGAYGFDSAGGRTFVESPEPEPFVDAVGAGDAFAAAAIVCLSKGASTEATLRVAASFAARTCTIQGATTTNPEHYRMESVSNA